MAEQQCHDAKTEPLVDEEANSGLLSGEVYGDVAAEKLPELPTDQCSATTESDDAPSHRKPVEDRNNATSITGNITEELADDQNGKESSVRDQEETPVDVEEAAVSSNGDTNNEEPPMEEELSQKRSLLTSGLVVLLLVALAVVTIAVPVIMNKRAENDYYYFDDDYWSGDDGIFLNGSLTDDYTNLVPGIANFTVDAMWRRSYGPQMKAFKWADRDPLWETYDDWRKRQRYAMACLHLSSTDSYYMPSNTTELHECDWFNYTTQCNDDGQVVGLNWTKMEWTYKPYRDRAFLTPEVAYLSNLEFLDFSDTMLWLYFRDYHYDEATDHYDYEEVITHIQLETVLPPNVLGNLSTTPIKVLKASGCSLDGTLPSQLGLLTSLTELDVSLNEFNSTIPSELGLLTDINSLHVQSNNLNGTMPEQLGDLPLLNVFNAEENLLEEIIPGGFCEHDHVPMVRLSTDWCWVQDHCCDR